MSYYAKVIADSVAPNGQRLTTIQARFPRFILAEFNTHRDKSRNSASSRAIPVERRIREVRDNPFVPEAFASNKRGMQAGDTFDDREQSKAADAWLRAARAGIECAEALADLGAHKQWANRPLELFSWHDVVITATDWSNSAALRCSPQAQPEARIAFEHIRDAMLASQPKELSVGSWHLPYVVAEDFDDPAVAGMGGDELALVSSARCARVSYLTQDGKRDVVADLDLSKRLLAPGHMSPFEHAAQVAHDAHMPPFSPRYAWIDGKWVDSGWYCGNFRAPWIQYRKMIANEADFSRRGTGDDFHG